MQRMSKVSQRPLHMVLALGLTHATLARARRDGDLRYARKGQRVLYLGRWVVEWISIDIEDKSSPGQICGGPAGRAGAKQRE